MPVHDWSRVDAGAFHDFHNVWIALLRIAFNTGLLPEGFYAMSEQHGGKYIADVLTLHRPTEPETLPRVISGGVAVADAPPKVRHHRSLSPATRSLRKTLTVRHVSDHRIVALVEIVSPANKDRRESVEAFLDKLEEAVTHGIHLLVVDLFRPSKSDPHGLHCALLERLGEQAEGPPRGEPLTLASYLADDPVEAYWEYLAVGSVLPEMPLFLDPEVYVKPPLEATYQAAWASTPEYYREMLEQPRKPRRRKRSR
jgi:hypothetical protein